MNECSVCAGTGKPVSGLPCICGGTGRQSDEMRGLRLQIQQFQSEKAELLEVLEKIKQLDTADGTEESLLCDAIGIAETGLAKHKGECVMSEELKPCPFCGGTDIEAGYDPTADFACYFVCSTNKSGCGASSGMREDMEEAIAAWNRRVSDG